MPSACAQLPPYDELTGCVVRFKPLVLALAGLACAATAADEPIETITVRSGFRADAAEAVPASVSVIDAARIADSGAVNVEDLMGTIANLNWAGTGSRPRFFQIRGVGETEDYRGVPSNAVGVVVDDIDLTGVGMATSLYDLDQLEVLRGPHSTRFGGSAMAGLLYYSSAEPSAEAEGGAEATIGDDDLVSLAAHSGGQVGLHDDIRYRVAVQSHKQNGYRDNAYLGSDDSNGRDELTLRGKLGWQVTDQLKASLAVLHADFDNGYDAWTLDNNGFTTLSDEPGFDSQRTTGSSLRFDWQGQQVGVTSITSGAATDHRHAYDGDWANPGYWAGRDCVDYYDENGNGDDSDLIPCQYDYWWDKQAERRNLNQELRLLSTKNSRLFAGTTDWLVGVWGQRLDESNDLDSRYNGYPDQVVQSDTAVRSWALFGQLDTELSERWRLSLGARSEQRQLRYDDSDGESFNPDEQLWGGHLALSYLLDEQRELFAKVARGYQAGGFNMGLPEEFRQYQAYDSETLYNSELGLKGSGFDGRLQGQLVLFYMVRDNQQVNGSVQDPANPQDFILYTTNAARSNSYGAEIEGSWLLLPSVELYASLGLLQSEYDDFLAAQSDGSFLDQQGRELAHAPNWQGALGATWRSGSGWFSNLQLAASDDFYYSDDHNQMADGYATLGARFGYEASQWSAYLWGRNLTDEKYSVRGFYFGNEPDQDWAPKVYERYADPRQIGVTVRYLWQ